MIMVDTLSYFQNNFLLSSLTEAELTSLLLEATAREFAAGDTLLCEGDEGHSMILINRGEVDVRRGQRHLARLSASTVLGEMALLDPAPRTASVIALTAGTLYEFHRDQLWDMVRRGDSAAIKTLQKLTVLMCQRLQEVNGMIQQEVVAPKGHWFSRLWQKLFPKSTDSRKPKPSSRRML